eukprot:gene8371-9269_t
MASQKMAPKMLSFYVLQFGALLALNFQLYGLIMTYKMFAHRNNLILASFLSSRQSKLKRKRKHALARQLRRKQDQCGFRKAEQISGGRICWVRMLLTATGRRIFA